MSGDRMASTEKVRAFRDAVERFLTSASNPGMASTVVNGNTPGSPYHDLVMAKIEVDAMLTESFDDAGTVPPKEPSPEWILKARAEGRAEFLTLLLDQHPESLYSDYTGTHSLGESGDHDEHWKADKLRELFKVDDAAWSLIDNLSASYWSQQSRIDELDRIEEIAASE